MDPMTETRETSGAEPAAGRTPTPWEVRSEVGLELWNLLKGRSTRGASKLWQVAREYPMPSVVVGLGVGWLLVESSRKSEARAALLATAREKVKDAAESAREKVGEAADWTREQASDLGHQVAEKASDLGQQVADKASDLGQQATLQARRARLGFWQTMEETPLRVGVAALALGVLAGLALPSTSSEDELMGETRDRLLDNVKEAGQEAIDRTVHVA